MKQWGFQVVMSREEPRKGHRKRHMKNKQHILTDDEIVDVLINYVDEKIYNYAVMIDLSIKHISEPTRRTPI